MKKDDFLVTIMQVPPKQRNNITPFDLRTQRDAFSVSLEGLKGVRILAITLLPPSVSQTLSTTKCHSHNPSNRLSSLLRLHLLLAPVLTCL